jgi:hypothetical protein
MSVVGAEGAAAAAFGAGSAEAVTACGMSPAATRVKAANDAIQRPVRPLDLR